MPPEPLGRSRDTGSGAFMVNDALKANRAFARDFDGAGVPAPPARQLVVLTCMDARLTPEDFLDLAIGDAHILRNAGAVASDDVLRSLVLSTRLMDTRHVFVVGHTQCALEGTQEGALRIQTHADDMTFHSFPDLEEHVQAQVRRIETSRWLPDGLTVHGFVYQVEDGVLRQVV